MSATALFRDARALPVPEAVRDRVDLWVIVLNSEPTPGELDCLDPDERAFVARLRSGAGSWLVARAGLRRVLGSYLDLSPADVAIEAGPNGKPRLVAGSGPDLRFSLSHSGKVALVAVRLGHEVGVDVEAIRPGVDTAAIARENFDPFERDAFAADGSDRSFFRAWARHEALAKATGRGIVDEPEPGARSRYRVLEVDGIAGHAAALASEGDGWSVRRV